MLRITENTFVVFDLDDTLYLERDYQTSGLRAVGHLVSQFYGRDLVNELIAWRDAGEPDLLERLVKELSLPRSVKESFLWAYRLHAPEIALYTGVAELLDKVRTHAAGVAVLTDGRSVSQRLKLKALGLSDLPVFISEEWGETKPGERRFREIQATYSALNYVYVGDNPQKDFLAPNKRGWQSIGIRDDGNNIHRQSEKAWPEENQPTVWLDSISEIESYLC